MSYDDSGFFIGRDTDLQNTAAILSSESCRLLTILGIGGIGKTRLAIHLARSLESDFRDGSVFVNLQHISREELFVPALFDALSLSVPVLDDGLEQLAAFLKDKQCLILLDNFEQITETAPVISRILSAAPQVKCLVTSRIALHLHEEHLYTLSGLSVPDADASEQEISRSNAVQLFLHRAQQLRHDFEPDLDDIAEITRIVDGSPLAIELAAVPGKVLTAGEILEEIRDCIEMLQTDLRNIPERHRSISAVFQGSWNLLTDNERQTLVRLSIFEGDFDRHAASTIANASLMTLIELRDKSLLIVQSNGRYGMHALIRELTRKHLEPDSENSFLLHQKHSQYYAEFTGTQSDKLRGKEQLSALSAIQLELQNIRSGWKWAVAQLDAELLEQYLFGIVLFYQMKGRSQEALDIVTLPDEVMKQVPAGLSVQIQLLQGWLQIIVWKNVEGVETTWNAINQLENPPLWFGMMLIPSINQPEIYGNRYDKLLALAESALASTDNLWERGWLLKAIGEYHFVAGQYDPAASFLEQSAQCFEQVEDNWAATWAYGNLGRSLAKIQKFDEAEQIYLKSIAICRDIGDTSGWIDLMNKRAELALAQNHYRSAEDILLEGFEMVFRYHVPYGELTYLLYTFAKLRIAQNHHSAAVEYLTVLLNNAIVHRGWREPEIEMLQTRLDSLYGELGEAAFTTAVQRGESLDMLVLVQSLLAKTEKKRATQTSDALEYEDLTEREFQILQLLVTGMSNNDIAAELTLALGTVKTHIHNLYGKLGVSTRAEAIARAHELNLV